MMKYLTYWSAWKEKDICPSKYPFHALSLKFSVLLPSDDFIFIAGKLSDVVLLSLAMAFFSQVGHENKSTVAAFWKYSLFSLPQNVTEDLLDSFICFRKYLLHLSHKTLKKYCGRVLFISPTM